MREQDRKVRVTPEVSERRLSGDALIEHAAERVDVCPPVDLATGDLLGCDVVDRAHQPPVGAAAGLVGQPLGEPEVRQVHVVGAVRSGADVEQDVGGLDVAMDEAARVGGIQGDRHLGDDPDRVRRIHGATLQPRLQVAPADIAHGDEEDALGSPGLVDGDDVRMIDRRRQLRLA